ncbi:MAG: ATP-binding protein [Lachnospiraceae bacterium]|nr:ATP-binding protein [Lachnospiraceae bacterium]
MFIGRELELNVLEETYNQPGFQMTVIYGRRRIGKSTLITEFIKGKRASYYVAAKSSLEDNVKKWSAQFISDIVPEMDGVEFSDLEGFFKFAGNSCKGKKTIIALDEIPYIAEADESFLSRFQGAIDSILSKKNIYLIISGSAISFMEKKILSEKSPLFGRRSNQIFLRPFDYLDSAKFVPDYNNEEKAVVFGVTGGVAKYLTLFDDSISIDDNLINNFFKPSGYLYEEPYNLLMQEFRTVSTYNMVIEACSGGANKVNEIADKVHESTAAVSYTIKNLTTVGVLAKVSAITDEKNKKKVNYEIVDGMYRFWYRFIPKGRAAVEMNRGDVYYNTYVKNNLHDFMGEIFEDMCRYYVLSNGLDGRLKCLTTNVGKWWGMGPDRIPTDIDVVGIDEAGKKAVLGECKFKNEQIDKPVYESLMNKKGLIDRKYDEVQYMFFSLSGFSKWVVENADAEKVSLLTLDDLYS